MGSGCAAGRVGCVAEARFALGHHQRRRPSKCSLRGDHRSSCGRSNRRRSSGLRTGGVPRREGATMHRRPSAKTRADASGSGSFRPATWRDLHLDWGRRHLQVVFVDTDHGVLARGAEGVCHQVAMWAGAGHMIFPESAGLMMESRDDGRIDGELDERLRMLTRLEPICEHTRYASKARWRLTDEDAACADLVVTVGGDDVEARALAAAPSANAVVDLWEFAQFAELGEIDGTGAAKILKRAVAREVVAPVLAEAMAAGRNWGRYVRDGSEVGDEGSPTASGSGEGASGKERAERNAQWELSVSRARLVVGVVGLVTFLMATAPLEEVERYCRKDSTWASGGGGGSGLEGLAREGEEEGDDEERAGDGQN